ncbi:MAG: tRNA (N(6)-L-threonylcarbamoyladenosine(37)-C(2))-methylthiotransferase MtaB [Acidiferrobacterales bacterium]|nr:tRNA (N(6)-L-threonylcarbamoyladenosine(37)-C(2))-methylthiotransferase MtaB [Acidiferrobacterales bacterium]
MSSIRVSVTPHRPETALKPVPSGRKKLVMDTMGCKVNSFESELISEKLGSDFERVQEIADADIFIINTCTVTVEADRQARQLVRRAIRANPEAWVVVTGCYAQMDPDACAGIPGVDLVVGNSQKLDIPNLLAPMMKGALPPVMLRDIDQEISLPDQLVTNFDGRTRAFVQIQQGCDQGCTFCIIHTARGPNRSFDGALIKRQIQRLIMNGYKEIVICGVDIGSYGSDKGEECGLVQLLHDLIQIEGDFRLRLSSIDPIHITPELASLMGRSRKICPQLHLSMQSADTLILKRMKRRATRELLYERIQNLREEVPDLVLSADILVGFPTESEAHFEATLAAVEDLEIPFPHVFPYSARPGTPAARIPKQVPMAVRKERAKLVRQAGARVWRSTAEKLVGSSQTVLTERPQMAKPGGFAIGRAANYFQVRLDSEHVLENSWQEVEIIDVGRDCLIARTRTGG